MANTGRTETRTAHLKCKWSLLTFEAIFLMLNAVPPFITPDPPRLANLPLVIAIMAFMLAFGLSHIRAERARAAEL